jgi:hypothetical protein
MPSPWEKASVISSSRLPRDEHDIVLHQDGTWDPSIPKKEGEFCFKLSRTEICNSILEIDGGIFSFT